MPCDNNCKSHQKATANTNVFGHRLMIGERFCLKAKRKLTASEAGASLAPEWCPNGIDKKNARAKKKSSIHTVPAHGVQSSPVRMAKKDIQTMSTAERVHDLVAQLNRYRDEYYNKNTPSVSDAAYDRLFAELRQLEQETGYIMGNSPTQTVGYKTVSNLEKAIHTIPLLSLDDTKDINSIISFAGTQPVLLMYKLDGLTVKLEYENGELVRASTRGDGNEGEIVTHNAPAISGIPQRIPFTQKLVVIGEAFIHRTDFDEIQKTLLDSSGKPYKNGRNLAAGSVRCFEASACLKRRVHFIPFNVQTGLDEDPATTNSKASKLNRLSDFGFSLCGFTYIAQPQLNKDIWEAEVDKLKTASEFDDIPIDGLVCTYDDIAFSKSCGKTGHHYKDGFALKFEDGLHQTTFRSIKWTSTRTGLISAVALFDTVVIDGCDVSKATIHNLTILKELELTSGCRILVSKRNMIIPHIEDNLDRGSFSPSIIPSSCPCCGQPTRIQIGKDDDNRKVEQLYCDNSNCESQTLRKFVHFAGKKALDIEGISKATLEQFIDAGIVETFVDIYHLDRYRDDIIQMEGFGEKSFVQLWDAIQTSRNTTFDRYLISMDIPMIGRRASAVLNRQFGGSLDAFEAAVNSGFDFSQLPGFGKTLNQNIHDWFKEEENKTLWKELQTVMTIQNSTDTIKSTSSASTTENMFKGKTIVATGKLINFSRASINAKIESLGAKAGDSVTAKTDYLIFGERAGSKLDKARNLGVKVISEKEFLEMVGTVIK